jgi:hypothetical protein
LRSQSDSSPYPIGTINEPSRIVTATGVRYPIPDLRPRWMSTPHGGRYGANKPIILLVARRLNFAITRISRIPLTIIVSLSAQPPAPWVTAADQNQPQLAEPANTTDRVPWRNFAPA